MLSITIIHNVSNLRQELYTYGVDNTICGAENTTAVTRIMKVLGINYITSYK